MRRIDHAWASPAPSPRRCRDHVWFTETGPAKRLVGFDPKSEKFFANIEVSGTIRHMHFDKQTRMMWFGTDANTVGRIALQKTK